MRVGTVGFIGANLTSAREARQITQASLSRLIDVSRTAVSEFESGRKTPSPETMQRIQDVLNLPYDYFQRTPLDHEAGPIFYRSMSSATKTARMAAEARFRWLKEIVQYLQQFMTFPEVNFPDFALPNNPWKIDFDLIEELAGETRKHWNLGPGNISNITWLLENNGAIVARFALEAESLDAFSEWSPVYKSPFIILGSDKRMAARSRFDAAHELAHIVLHRHIDKTRITNTSDFKLLEKQAHRFAAAFLFPAEAYLQEVFMPDLDLFRNLKAIWKVSIQMQIQRGTDLGIISSEQSVRLWKNFMRRGWKRREPLDDQLEVETPRVLARSLDLLLNENVQSRFDILAALPFSAGDILELTGLSRSYFEDRPDTVVYLKDYQDRRAPKVPDNSPTNELPMGGELISMTRKRG